MKMDPSIDELLPTRQSLLSRLRDWDDQESWREFFDTYWRLIHGLALKCGLTDAEAQDVVQETMVSVAMSMTNATVAQATADRSVFFLDDGSLDPQLLIGYTPQSAATLRVRENRCHVELRDRPEVLEVIGKQSIVEFLHERAPKQQ